MDERSWAEFFEKVINTKVVIKVKSGLYKGSFPSRIEDVRDGAVAVSHPFFKNGLVPLYKDTILELITFEKQPPMLIQMKVLRRSISNDIPLLWLLPSGEPVKIQRRRYARVSCYIEIGFFSLSREKIAPFSASWEEASGLDISLGGIRMRSKVRHETLEEGDRLYLRFNIDPNEEIYMISNVVRVIREGEFLESGLQFEGYPRSTERRLLQFIRSKELRNAKDVFHD